MDKDGGACIYKVFKISKCAFIKIDVFRWEYVNTVKWEIFYKRNRGLFSMPSTCKHLGGLR